MHLSSRSLAVKAYLVTTGLLFGTVAVLHIWRVIVEPHLASHAWYLLLTLLAAALAVWAWRLFRSQARS
jgi:hypothetical protein